MASRKADALNIDESSLLDYIDTRIPDKKQTETVSQAAVPDKGQDELRQSDPVQLSVSQAREKATKEGSRRKRTEEDNWDAVFRQKEIKTRQCVYISRDVHNKILKIVSNIADNKISVGAFTDNILSLYLEQNKDRINELYRKQRDDLI